MMTARTIVLWWGAASLAFAAIYAAAGYNYNRQQRRNTERLEQAKAEKAERYRAALYASEIRNARRRGNVAAEAAIRKFHDQLAALPETPEPKR